MRRKFLNYKTLKMLFFLSAFLITNPVFYRWKDPGCPFRKDPKTRLLVVPTLKRWNAPQKLEGEQCEKSELVSMLFTHNEDD